jgi:hypothetical protein
MTRKRVRRTAAEWSALVSEQTASGQSLTAFARARSVSLASLAYWKKKLEKRSPGVSVVEPKTKTMFSEVVVVPRVRATVPRIEVVTRHGSAIRIEGAFDASLLREVLRVAESC